MEKKVCCFIKIGKYGHCSERATKESDYCKQHNYILKNNRSIVKPCIKCGLGTKAIWLVCCACGGNLYRMNKLYAEKIRPYALEASRMRRIEL